jgi:hypothetical protein
MPDQKMESPSLEDLQNDPNKYGLPTFEQFRKDKHKWRLHQTTDDTMACVDAGDRNLKAHQRYYVNGYWVPSLESAEIHAKNMGLDLHEHFNFFPQVIHEPGERLGYYIAVHFRVQPFVKWRNRRRGALCV